MTISRVKPGNWSLGDKLTSSDANALDTNVTNALDKRSGQTDTLQCVVSESGAGRIIDSYLSGADADTTYQLSSGISYISAEAITAPRAYTLSNTGASAGDRVVILAGAQPLTVKDASSATLIVLGNSTSGNAASPWGEFRHNGSVWKLAEYGTTPTIWQVFTGNGTFTVPPSVYKLKVIACGGGGGGAGGGGAYFGGTYAPGGGGGGGAAPLGIVAINTTPGTSIAVTIGTGGTAGTGGSGAQTAGNNGNDGNDGGNTTFGSLATFYGGQGGTGGAGAGSTTNTQYNVYAPGGCGPASGVKADRFLGSSAGQRSPLGVRNPGEGGYGGAGGSSSTGSAAGAAGNYPAASSTTGGGGSTTGGAGGAAGTIPGGRTSRPGGGGGGGGASLFGNGGAGGAGANATDATGLSGSNGSAGTAGAGGGGGGGAGGNDTAGGTYGSGGNGAAGGNGVLIVIPIR